MATKRVKKVKAKAKASVRVNVNVNSKNRKVVRGRQFPVPYPTALPPTRVEVQSSTPQQPIIIHQPPMMRDTTHPVGIHITNGQAPPQPEPTHPKPQAEEAQSTGAFQGVKEYITKGADTLGNYAIGTGSAISAVGFPGAGGALATAGTALKAVPKATEIYESGKKLLSSAKELLPATKAEPEIQSDWKTMTKAQLRDYISKTGGDLTGKSKYTVAQLTEYAKSLG